MATFTDAINVINQELASINSLNVTYSGTARGEFAQASAGILIRKDGSLEVNGFSSQIVLEGGVNQWAGQISPPGNTVDQGSPAQSRMLADIIRYIEKHISNTDFMVNYG